AFGGLAGRRTHASQHLLFGPTDHRGLRVGSEAGALDFARRKRKARKQREEAGTSHQRRLAIIWQRDRSVDARNELAAFHSITSSASASSDGLGMLFMASAHYRIKSAHTAKYKSKPHAIAINVSQIATLPNLGTCP